MSSSSRSCPDNVLNKANASNADQDYLTPQAGEKTVKQTSMLLICLFVIGGLVLLFMIKKTTPASALAGQDESQMQLETAIAQLTGATQDMPDQMKKIVKRFYDFSNVTQVRVADLNKNPFNHVKVQIQSEPICAQDASIAGSVLKQGIMDVSNDRELPQKSSSEPRLYGVMKFDKVYCCLINDFLLYEGDMYGNQKIKKITDEAVVLQAGNTEMVLKIASNED